MFKSSPYPPLCPTKTSPHWSNATAPGIVGCTPGPTYPVMGNPERKALYSGKVYQNLSKLAGGFNPFEKYARQI